MSELLNRNLVNMTKMNLGNNNATGVQQSNLDKAKQRKKELKDKFMDWREENQKQLTMMLTENKLSLDFWSIVKHKIDILTGMYAIHTIHAIHTIQTIHTIHTIHTMHTLHTV